MFVVQGCKDWFKSCVILTSSVVGPFSIKMTVEIDIIKRFYQFSTDVTQAYPQSGENLKKKGT